MKPILKKVFTSVIYFALVLGLIYFLPKGLSHWLGTPYPMAAITSGSMWPALNEGDLVLIHGVKSPDLRVGDVVVYRNEEGGGGFTIHRVVRLLDDRLVTKGDANFTEDEPIRYEQVVGRNVSLWGHPLHVPYLGSITVWANSIK